jgi:hypothetical protein
MAATPITVTVRYTPPGRRKYNWLTAVAAYPGGAPTRAEINAGSDLSGEIVEVNGFELTGDSADAPDLGGGFVAQVPARVSASDSEIVFYASSNSNDIRTVLPRGTAGYILVLPEGDVPTQKCEVWPATVKSMFIDGSVEDPGKVHVQFSITRIPVQNLTIPA